MNRREQELETLLAPTVESLGLQLWGIEYLSNGRRSLLRVYIDSDQGVSVDDCETVSHQISGILDVEQPIGSRYTLEVSSPGLDRILFKPEHYATNVGADVDVRLNFPLQGRRRFTGRLVDLEDEEMVVRVDDDEYVLPLEQVQRTRLVPQFD